MTSSSLLQRAGTYLLVSVLALGVACGGDDDNESSSGANGSATTAAASATSVPQLTAPTAPPTTAAPNKLTIQNFTFMGIDATKANTTWSITNSDSVPHTVTADDNSFVWRVEGGQTGTFAKTLAPGSYPIHCDIHPARMKGVLVVQ